MTQTVDSRVWSDYVSIKALYFRDTIEPPTRISADELLRSAGFTKDDSLGTAGGRGWLDANPLALDSVLRGLSQAGNVDRGSFASYAD